MNSHVPSHNYKGSKCIVKIQQDHQGYPITLPKPRLATAYPSTSTSTLTANRSSSPLFPPTPSPPPPPPERTPSPSMTSTFTRPKCPVPTNVKSHYNKTQPDPPMRTSINVTQRNNKIYETTKEVDIEFNKTFTNIYYKQSDNIFLSQLYLMFHLAITFCLIRNKVFTKSDNESNLFVSSEDAIFIYLSYMLATSILFLVLLRCYGTNTFGEEKILTENRIIIIGSLLLCIIQLVKLGLDVAVCIENELVFIPVLQFIFSFFLMHFILTHVSHSEKHNFNNIALAHLLSTQLSLWLFDWDFNYHGCTFNKDNNKTFYIQITKDLLSISNILNIFMPIIHQYKLLTTFIIITIWAINHEKKNPKTKSDSETSFISEYSSSSIKGFVLGLITLFAAITILFMENESHKITTHTIIQGAIALASIIGLINHKKDKYNIFNNHTHSFGCRFLIYITLFASYICGFVGILKNNSLKSFNWNILANGILLIIQMTIQSFLIKAQEKSFIQMRGLFTFLLFSNLSLWLLEIYEVSNIMGKMTGIINIITLFSLIVSLNRYYSFLLFIQFWRQK